MTGWANGFGARKNVGWRCLAYDQGGGGIKYHSTTRITSSGKLSIYPGGNTLLMT